jgi:hypothetical protein
VNGPARCRVGLEVGTTWVFASALDWPGWCRRGKSEEAAIDALLDYAERYAVVAGPGFAPGEPAVVGRVRGNASTDFGAPDGVFPSDAEPLEAAEAVRMTGLLEASWRVFDGVAAGAPPVLRKGPRGGGRDTDAIVEHVREAERSYGRKIGVRMPPRTPWPEQRAAIAGVLRAGAAIDLPVKNPWSPRYAFRRFTWHVLDHAWEIEDKSG